jgi:hypothetical protein
VASQSGKFSTHCAKTRRVFFTRRSTVRAVYDGSLFERLEKERKEAKEVAKKK